jgi:hypothetical protein
MPFDGAEFLNGSSSICRRSSATTEKAWFRRLQAIFESKGKGVESFRETHQEENAPATLRLLGEARQLIAARQHWTRGIYRTLSGKYCAVGALQAAGQILHDAAAQKAAHELLKAVARNRGFPTAETMNDRSTHEQVLAAFDEAIAAARQRVGSPTP